MVIATAGQPSAGPPQQAFYSAETHRSRACLVASQWVMPFLDNGPARLFFTDSQPDTDRRPIVFVHGWTCDSHDWIWQLSALQDHERVVALDLRGHGRSNTPDHGFAPADYADDVTALLRRLSAPPAILVGHSMGALISSLIVDRTPDLVYALVVVDPPYGNQGSNVAVAREFARNVGQPDGVQSVYDWLRASDSPNTPGYLATWHRRRILGMAQHALTETVLDVHDREDSIANAPHSQQLWARRRLPTLVIAASPAGAEREVEHFMDPRS